MKLSNLVLIVTMAFCLTLVTTAQLRAQELPLVPPPIISLDFAQYCTGNSWTFKLIFGSPNTSARLLGTTNGQPWEIDGWGSTDSTGSFTLQGTFAEGTAGSYSLQMEVAGILSNRIYFVISQCSVQGSRIAFVSTRDGGGPAAGFQSVPYIYVANADGSGVTRLTQGENPAWSADGQKILFESHFEIRVINADGSNERVLGQGKWPSLSPDGTKILFFDGSGGISMMNVDGSGLTQLVSAEFANPGWGDYAVELPAWSPDGRSISFVRANYEDGWTVHILDLATSQITPVTVPASGLGDSRPVWSPDGAKLLVQVIWAIVAINRDGSGFQTYVAGYVENPDWSPDGNSIVFAEFSGPGDAVSALGSRMRIYIENLSDGSVRQLIPEAVNPALPNYWDSQPAWSRVRQ
jgi:Tol biopolymer transport system component